MDGFASAAMFRLVRAGLEALGHQVPDLAMPKSPHVSVGAKRAVLSSLLERHGTMALLRVPEVLPHLPREPALQALLLARDPADLLKRWGRLERFAHSDHRIVWSEPSPGRIEMAHVAVGSAPAPTAGEDLIVFTLLSHLCEMIGVVGLCAGPANSPSPWRLDGRWDEGLNDAGQVQTACWTWLFEETGLSTERSAPNPVLGDTAHRLRLLVLADPGRRWTLASAAGAMGTSSRTLQRHLAETGVSLTSVIAAARVERAALCLSTTDMDIAEIGFVCGYADQAHFSRAFKAYSAMTPARFRSDFRREPMRPMAKLPAPEGVRRRAVYR